jgi:hypothetical protein
MGQARSTYGDKRNLDTVLAAKSQGKTVHGETELMCEDNIKMYFKAIGSEGVEGIHRLRIGRSGELL